jgi:hypothetical protein
MLFADVNFKANDFFVTGRHICQKVSALSEQEFAELSVNLNEYEMMLKEYGILDEVISSRKLNHVLTMLSLLITIPFSLLGYCLWHVHFVITKWISDKTVTRDDFYTSVFSGIAGIIGLVWWIFLCMIGLLLKSELIFVLCFFSPVFYYVSLFWREKFMVLFSALRFYFLSKSKQELYYQITSSRNQLAYWN